MRRQALISLSYACVFGLAAAAAAAAEPKKRDSLQIGIARTLFNDIPDETVRASMGPFQEVITSEIGLKGELRVHDDAAKLADEMAKDAVQLGVFNGFEFAWARQKDPRLTPLAVAVNQDRHLRVLVLARKNDPATRFADLAGKTLALAKSTREFCRFFLDRRCRREGRGVKESFGKTVTPANLEDALDDVVDGKADAALGDGVGLARYRERKPARFARLKVVEQSIVFPAAVIAYRKGALEPETTRRMLESLLNYSQTPEGQQQLVFWKMSAFEAVPEDYDKTLADFIKAYPPAEAKRQRKP